MFSNPNTSINKRNEFVSKCRHQNKFTLSTLNVDYNADILKHTIIPNADLNTNFEEVSIIRNIPRAKVRKKGTDSTYQGSTSQ